MINKSVDYCVNSTDHTCYNRLRVCLPAPTTEYCKLQVTTLTTQTEMIILDTNDYIKVEYAGYESAGEPYIINYTMFYEVKEMSASKLVNTLNTLAKGVIDALRQKTELDRFGNPTVYPYKDMKLDLQFELDMVDRMKIMSKYKFRILDISYNFRLLLGMYNKLGPLNDWYYETTEERTTEKDNVKTTEKVYLYKSDSIGYYLSTPVLYLIANVGEQCFRTTEGGKVRSNRVVMKINNSFSSGCAMICYPRLARYSHKLIACLSCSLFLFNNASEAVSATSSAAATAATSSAAGTA